jgi:hypothetical protein
MHASPSALQTHPETNVHTQSHSLLSLLTIGASKPTNLHRKIAHQFVEQYHLSKYAIHHPPPNIPFINCPSNPSHLFIFPQKNTNRYAKSPPARSNSQSPRIPQKSTKHPPDSKPRAASLPPALNCSRLAVALVLFGIGVATAVAALVVAAAVVAAAAVTVATIAVVVICEMLVIASDKT